jgi:serine/threonine protein kinase
MEVTARDLGCEKSASQQTASALLGETIGRYKITEILGTGGMAVVYKAEDTLLGRPIALKLLRKDTSDVSALERFIREAKAAHTLNHPNICRVYSIERQEEYRFITMEFLEGETLKQHISGRALEVMEILLIARQIAEGLYAAHCAGVIHRDIKSANVFITSKAEAKILDFGLAKLTADWNLSPGLAETSDSAALRWDKSLTRRGSALGTVAYMSPEQALGEELGLRTDLFSLGVVIYEMSTGRLPFTGNTPAAVFEEILHKEPLSPKLLNEKIPPELECIINKALTKEILFRYQSAKKMIADFDDLRRKLELGNQ